MEDRIVLSFFIYSFLGYICEVIYCSVPQRRFVNRGFLYGPYLPIYGFGAMIVTVLLDPLHQWPLLVFLLSFLLTSVLEYFTSWLLEKLFSVKLWDYSKHKVNINGRVCLLNSTLFGIMGLVAEYIVQPFMSRLAHSIPSSFIHPLAMSIAMLLSVDATFSVVKMASFKEGLARFRAFRREAEARISELVESGSRELADEMRARFEHDLERYRASFAARMGRIVRANPSITARSSEVRYQLDVLNEWTKARKDLKARYKAEMKALDDENIAKLRGGRR